MVITINGGILLRSCTIKCNQRNPEHDVHIVGRCEMETLPTFK